MGIFLKISNRIQASLSLLRYLTVPDSWKLLMPCQVLLLAHNNDRGFSIDGKSYSQLIHTLRYYFENKGYSCAGISTAFDVHSYKHNYYEDKTINIIFLRNILKAKIKAFLFKNNYSELKIQGELPLWQKILQKTQPKLVIAIQPSDSLCMVCHKLNIPVYDFQHGTITDQGISYGREYNLTKAADRLPTGYLCWDNASAALLNQWCPQRNIQVEVLGHPWLYRFNNPDSSDLLIKNISPDKLFPKDKKIILIALQWGLGAIYPDFFDKEDVIHSVLLDVIAELGNEVAWLIRLHPVHMNDKKILRAIKKLFKNTDSVEIEWASTLPLPLVLSVCHGHITWDSSVVLEAAHYGVPSFVLNPGHFSIYFQTHSKNESKLPYIQQEIAGLVRRSLELPNKKDVIHWISQLPMNPSASPSSPLDLFQLEKLYQLLEQRLGSVNQFF